MPTSISRFILGDLRKKKTVPDEQRRKETGIARSAPGAECGSSSRYDSNWFHPKEVLPTTPVAVAAVVNDRGRYWPSFRSGNLLLCRTPFLFLVVLFRTRQYEERVVKPTVSFAKSYSCWHVAGNGLVPPIVRLLCIFEENMPNTDGETFP